MNNYNLPSNNDIDQFWIFIHKNNVKIKLRNAVWEWVPTKSRDFYTEGDILTIISEFADDCRYLSKVYYAGKNKNDRLKFINDDGTQIVFDNAYKHTFSLDEEMSKSKPTTSRMELDKMYTATKKLIKTIKTSKINSSTNSITLNLDLSSDNIGKLSIFIQSTI